MNGMRSGGIRNGEQDSFWEVDDEDPRARPPREDVHFVYVSFWVSLSEREMLVSLSLHLSDDSA